MKSSKNALARRGDSRVSRCLEVGTRILDYALAREEGFHGPGQARIDGRLLSRSKCHTRALYNPLLWQGSPYFELMGEVRYDQKVGIVGTDFR